jgi:hypothetical protein
MTLLITKVLYGWWLNKWMSVAQLRNATGRGNLEVRGEKPLPVQFYLLQIPHGPDWNQTPASAVRDRRQTPWARGRDPKMLQTNVLVVMQRRDTI